MRTLVKVGLKDNTKTRVLLPDMTYEFVKNENGVKNVNSQEWLMKHSIKAGGNMQKH
jgi:hypothetical protein